MYSVSHKSINLVVKHLTIIHTSHYCLIALPNHQIIFNPAKILPTITQYYIVTCKASWGEPEQFYKQLYIAIFYVC